LTGRAEFTGFTSGHRSILDGIVLRFRRTKDFPGRFKKHFAPHHFDWFTLLTWTQTRFHYSR